MAKTKVYNGWHITCAIADKDSGDPVALGDRGLHGVCLIDTDADGNVVIDTHGVHDLSVEAAADEGNRAIAIGDPIFYTSGDDPVLNAKASGIFFGYALEAISSGSTDTINVLVMPARDNLPSVGTSSAPLVEDNASVKFVSRYTDCGATSGDSRGTYLRHYITGAGGGGECLRIFTTVDDVEAATAHGAHISLNFGDEGSLTGLGAAVRATLHIPNQAWGSSGGTLAAIQAEIWSDGSDSDPAGLTSLSFIRFVVGGDTDGDDDVETDAVLFDLSGFTSGGIWTDTTSNAADEFIKVRTPSGIRYLILSDSTTFA